ncbi:GNAT family N-acetyltransferase [uncultured Alistipes sp.]|jgi:hypothetical protein|uniref:GNAT family N-acetyltransferase n=1 Tax=uncultured Alistipes sp. TaxID=538949 RepID=UPI0025E82DD9|nr:GNAT family N-acetyltransferase [uncultured Alistipes sp.]
MHNAFIIKHFSELTLAEYHRIVRAREEVFFLEQHITEPDADAVDVQSVFVWLEHEGRVIAFLRMIPAGILYSEASIGRVLVDAGYRKQGLCREMMHEALRYIETHWSPQPIRISAQEYLAGFYSSLGFETISGIYSEAGIPHVKMLRK